MDDPIVLSSDTDDSDVEIIGSNSPVMTKADLPPLSAVRGQVDDAGVNLAKVSKQNCCVTLVCAASDLRRCLRREGGWTTGNWPPGR